MSFKDEGYFDKRTSGPKSTPMPSYLTDTQAFKHGQEGTHVACQARLNKWGNTTKCCICWPHDGCEL